MLQVLRMQMIRRFVFVFDPDFETYQEPLSVPPAIFTAIGRFLFLSAARNTPLLGHCKILLESIQSTQKEQLRRRVLDMARVATYKTKKRVRTDSQVNMLDARERLEMQDDDQGATRMVEYLERLRLADRTSDDDKIHRSFSEGVAAIGATRWARARRSGMARMSARKVELVEVAADAVPPLEAELGDEYLADHDSDMAAAERYDIILPRPLRTSLHHPVAPRTSIVELPEDEDNDEVVDDLADWDSSEDYVVTPPPHLQTGSPEYHIDDHDYAHNFIRHRSNSLGLSHVGVRDSIDFDSGRMNSLPRDGVLAGAEDTPLWEHVQARLAGYSLRDRMAPRTQYDDEVINDLDDEATWSPGFHPRLGSLPVAGDLDAEEDPFYYEEASRQDSFEECPDGSQGGAGAPTSHPHWAPAPAPLIHPRPPHLQAIETSATPSPIIRLPERLVEEGGMPGAGLAASYVSYPEAWDEGGGGGGHEVEVQIEDDRGREEVVYRGEGYGASRGHGEYAGHEGEGSQGWPSGDGAGHSAEHAAGEVYNDLDEW
ncbi:hypothetical protein Q8F55_007998 [Vanrija albida]|uniref:Rad21/Rec8-like protein N-terminal domain-containing protein n=1 Tax=Vanrija albida TaxID=181172 RepID=A0ABR3PV43_9TREE